MYSVVSLLPSPYDMKVKSAWKDLVRTCGVVGHHSNPHFCWGVAEEYDESKVKETFAEIATAGAPFSVKSSGLGLFTSMKPVVYVPIARTPEMSKLHGELWSKLECKPHQYSPLFEPTVWIPHIPIVDGDVDEQNIRDVLARLSWQNFDWEFEVNNLALLQKSDGEEGEIKFVCEL